MPDVPERQGKPQSETPFAGPGEACRLARAVRWDETPLGPPDRWPAALRGLVRTAMATPVPIALWAGPDFTLVHNDAYAPILGAKVTWAMGRPGREVWAEVWESLAPEFERVVATGLAVRYEDRPYVLRRSGREETGYFSFTLAPVFADDGRIVAIFNPCEETTPAVSTLGRLAQKQAFLLQLADALRPLGDADEIQFTAARLLGEHVGASRVLYSEIVDEHDLVVSRDWTDGAPSLVGRYPLSVFGEEPPELLRRGNLVIEDVETDPRLSDRARSAFRAMGATASMIASLVKEGRWVATLGVHSAVRRAWTPVELSLLEEVTERTWATVERARAEAAARESRQQLAAVIDQLPVAAGMLDMRGRFAISNAALRVFTLPTLPSGDPDQQSRWSGKDELGRPLPPERWPGARALRGETVSPGVEMTFRPEGGRELHTIVSAVPLRGPDGAQTGAIVAVQDVTRLKTAEEELRLANQQKADFLAVLSHELRNPLAPIRNGLYLLSRPNARPEQAARALEVLDRQTRHLTRLIDDLLDVTRISRGKVELQRSRLDLRDVVRKTTDDLRSIFDERGVALRVQHAAGPAWVSGDAVRLEQALANLLQNAVKFTPGGGTVTVVLSAAHGRATLSVRDTGEGMEPREVERMFEPFAQAAQSAARTRGGLGLGLALVKGFVELHGGTVRASSPGPGRGAEFTVELPLADPVQPRAAGEDADPGASAGPPLDVVVIEDNPDAGRTLADVLQLQGHRVRVALDGRAGLALVHERRPDLVLCDIGLPDMSGYEVARTLRAETAAAGIFLVALTGYAQPEDRVRAAEAGFDAHLAKPPSPERLAELLRVSPPAHA